MRRIFWIILLVLVGICIAMLILYAYGATRPWMETNVSPTIDMVTGGIASTIYYSAPIQYLIANPLISHIAVLILGICPISFPIMHRAFNSVRGKFVKSADAEAGHISYVQQMGKPQSISVAQQPESTSSKQPAATPPPPPAPAAPVEEAEA